MKNAILKLPIMFLCAITMVSCSTDVSKEVVGKYVRDSIFVGNAIKGLYISECDTVYSCVENTTQYQDELFQIEEYKKNILHQSLAYDFEEALLNESGTSKGLILLYQSFIRERIQRINNMSALYKPKLEGFVCAISVDYHTGLADSLAIGLIYLNKSKTNVMSYTIENEDPRNYANIGRDTIANRFKKLRLETKAIVIDTSYFRHFAE